MNITGSCKSAIIKLVSTLQTYFFLKDLGTLHYFLGVQVKKIQRMDLKLNMLDICYPGQTWIMPSLCTSLWLWSKVKCLRRSTFCRSSSLQVYLGALQYVTLTQLEIDFFVNKVRQYMQHPKEMHWKVVKRILKYLARSINYGLHLKKSSHLQITGYCDSNWASNIDDRRSTSSSLHFPWC